MDKLLFRIHSEVTEGGGVHGRKSTATGRQRLTFIYTFIFSLFSSKRTSWTNAFATAVVSCKMVFVIKLTL